MPAPTPGPPILHCRWAACMGAAHECRPAPVPEQVADKDRAIRMCRQRSMRINQLLYPEATHVCGASG